MEKIYNLFKFIEDKYPEYGIPLTYKLVNGIPLTKEELNIEGDLDLDYSHVTSLPDNLTISGYLLLYNCYKLTALPKGLTVGESLNLRGCVNLKSLPKGLVVGGDLYLGNTPIDKKYTEAEIREMCPGIKGKIL
jgi:hypothetical protein